ncbi:MAG: hypothetical protein WCX80_03975 [Patescibacteria group bacterium]|jgi:hypothetical protein
MISKDLIKEFQILVKEEYGRDLSDSEAFEISNQIVKCHKALKRLKLYKRFGNIRMHTNQILNT